jgi:metal-responsive CopG/Arc/MetJ family transcriptional regulator
MADTWIHARVGEDTRAELDRVAKNEDRTRSQMIRVLIGEALAARHEKEQAS